MTTKLKDDLVGRLFTPQSLTPVRLAFFDMDHTLINNDCDLSWKNYLVDVGQAGWTDRLRGRWHFWMYQLGRLNTQGFMRFQLAQFRGRTEAEMAPLLREHFDQYVLPSLYPAVPKILAGLKTRGIPCLLVTATNQEIAAPLAQYLGMDGLLATPLERDKDGRFTGHVGGVYCLGANKLLVMQPEAARRGFALEQVMYWGDSGNDIPVLEQVGFPVAANPAAKLRTQAQRRGWPIIDFSQIQ
jgi:HAD superfamily hydrolase (TIGR01490 family)